TRSTRDWSSDVCSSDLSSRPGPPLPGEVPGSEVFRISLRELKAGYPEKNILLQAKDTVYLPKASQVYVLGHVARPGAYRYEEGKIGRASCREEVERGGE